MDGPGRQYLQKMAGPGSNAAVLDRLLYETFLDPEARRRFAELFKEIEGLYEVLSPSAECAITSRPTTGSPTSTSCSATLTGPESCGQAL